MSLTKIKKRIRLIAPLVILAGILACVFYWLLPVTAQTQLSADAVRLALSTTDQTEVAVNSLVAPWILMLRGLSFWSIPAGEIYASAAAMNAWLTLFGLVVFGWHLGLKRFPVLLAVAFSPCFLWSAVIPNGFGLVFLLLVTAALVAKKNFQAGMLGVCCALTPVAWLLLIQHRQLGDKQLRGRVLASWLVWFFFGLIAIAATSSFSTVQSLSVLRRFFLEDTLAAGSVLLGFGGETAIASVGLLTAVVGILMRETRSKSFLLFLPFVGLVLNAKSWKFAHPGWNSVLQDAARNIEVGARGPMKVFLGTKTEEAVSRYYRAMISHASIEFLGQAPKTAAEFKKEFTYWLDAPPESHDGLKITFLGYGFRVEPISGSTQFQFDFESLAKTFTVSKIGVNEASVLEISKLQNLEMRVYSRYALYHLGLSRVIEKQKQSADWMNRATVEQYAALSKVKWLSEPYQKLCIERVTADLPPDIVALCKEVKSLH